MQLAGLNRTLSIVDRPGGWLLRWQPARIGKLRLTMVPVTAEELHRISRKVTDTEETHGPIKLPIVPAHQVACPVQCSLKQRVWRFRGVKGESHCSNGNCGGRIDVWEPYVAL